MVPLSQVFHESQGDAKIDSGTSRAELPAAEMTGPESGIAAVRSMRNNEKVVPHLQPWPQEREPL